MLPQVDRCETWPGMQARGQQLEAQTLAVSKERDRLLALANERRNALKGLEQELLEERLQLDARAKAERIKQISLIEDQYRCARACAAWARDETCNIVIETRGCAQMGHVFL